MTGERKPLKVTVIVEDPNMDDGKGVKATYEIPRVLEFGIEVRYEEHELRRFHDVLVRADNRVESIDFCLTRPMTDEAGLLYTMRTESL